MRKRKKYSPIQKPRPLHLERIMNLKRWTGILLICAAAFMALALFVMWGLPVLFPPEDPEDSLPQATVLPTASPAAGTEENDLPVLEDSVNLFVINEDHPADADFAPGKEDETGLKRNDLVLRYVGTEHAAAIRRLSFCLEEYLRYIGA